MSTVPGIQSFPLVNQVDAASGTLDWARDAQSVREVLWNILLTSPGERLMRPEFGAGLRDFIHHPDTETTRRLIADVARRAIARWEPRIELISVTASSVAGQPNRVDLNIHYKLRYSGVEDQFNLGLALQP